MPVTSRTDMQYYQKRRKDVLCPAGTWVDGNNYRDSEEESHGGPEASWKLHEGGEPELSLKERVVILLLKAKANINMMFPCCLLYHREFSRSNFSSLETHTSQACTLFGLTAVAQYFSSPIVYILTPQTYFYHICFSPQNVSTLRQRPFLIHFCFPTMLLSHRADMQVCLFLSIISRLNHIILCQF